MCDLGPFFTLLASAAVLIAASVAAIYLASALNAGFFSAPGAPIPMLAAAVSAGAASVLVLTAQQRLLEHFACLGSPAGCEGALSNLTEALEALAGVLAVQAIAAGAVAAVAWIPGVAQPAMWVIAAALLTQIGIIPTTIVYANEYLDCVKSTGFKNVPNPLIVAAGLSILFGLGLIRLSRRSRPPVR